MNINILAVDSTSNLASVTVAKYDNTCKKIYYNENNDLKTHSEKLLPIIDKTLKEANILDKDITTYLVTNGPGSFTGTRIGVTTIKGLTLYNNTKICAFSSLEIMAHALFKLIETHDYIVAILDAKGGRIYYGIYQFMGSDTNTIVPPTADTFENLKSTLSKMINNYIMCFDNIDSFIEKDEKSNNIYPINILINSSNILDYYTFLGDKTNYIKNTYDLDVEYVRPSMAERMKNGNKH